MKVFLQIILLSTLLLVTYVVCLFHIGTLTPPVLTKEDLRPGAQGIWIPKETYGIHQAILEGSPYQRGLEWGRMTKSLLIQQENSLIEKFEEIIPSSIIRNVFLMLVTRWYWGIDEFFDLNHLKEMYGVSKSASDEFNYLASPYTRQIAYHGLHEVGQSMIDSGWEGMGCTVFLHPTESAWLVGRNFDFEGGRIFDEEKIMKWVFPSKGIPFVSVIWAGMVGAVTGVNAKGVYISVNAAGTSDRVRYGELSTLVILKVLQNAKDAEHAIDIISKSKTLISEIFIVVDSKGSAYSIEKSPNRFAVLKAEGPTVVANHLISETFRDDPVNLHRKENLTTLNRQSRGDEILLSWESQGVNVGPNEVLGALRDKKLARAGQIEIGNRNTIDALIATHAVIFDSEKMHLYVSTGPSLVGEFVGFDIEKSFKFKTPKRIQEKDGLSVLKKDSEVDITTYNKIQRSRGAL